MVAGLLTAHVMLHVVVVGKHVHVPTQLHQTAVLIVQVYHYLHVTLVYVLLMVVGQHGVLVTLPVVAVFKHVHVPTQHQQTVVPTVQVQLFKYVTLAHVVHQLTVVGQHGVHVTLPVVVVFKHVHVPIQHPRLVGPHVVGQQHNVVLHHYVQHGK
jgi:hypothetical protein